jgi:hypothetical protein
MRAHRHTQIFRLGLLTALAFFSLNCEEGEDCACLDAPPPAPEEDEDPTPELVEPLPRELEETLSALAACEGGIETAFAAEVIEPPDADSEGYLPPGTDTLEALVASFWSVERGEATLAAAQVAVVGYELCRGAEAEEGVVLWRPLTAGAGRALFALRLHAAQPIQIGVPHPWQHPDTLTLARRAFVDQRARSLVSAGTHRCANSEGSGCAGDDTCGELPVVSDMAYSRNTVYQLAHELFADSFEEDLVLTVEGRERPGVKVSEGVVGELVTGGAARRLIDSLIIDGEQATSCLDESDSGRSELECGVHNVQGLYVNGVAAACGPASPPAAVGRFVHVAASADVAGDGEALLAAIDAAVPDGP